MTLNLDFTIQLLDSNRATISWDSPNAADVSWLFINGIKIFGPMAFGEVTRKTFFNFPSTVNRDIELHDFETAPSVIAPIGIEENKRPILKWRHLIGTNQYRVHHTPFGGVESLVATIDVMDERGQYTLISPIRLLAGYNQFRVEAVDQFGNESVRDIWVYQVFQLDDPVNDLTVSDGSGSGLFDFTIS